MNARKSLFHMGCFRCTVCERQLAPGDEFALRNDELVCKADYDLMSGDKNHVIIKEENDGTVETTMEDSPKSMSCHSDGGRPGKLKI